MGQLQQSNALSHCLSHKAFMDNGYVVWITTILFISDYDIIRMFCRFYDFEPFPLMTWAIAYKALRYFQPFVTSIFYFQFHTCS